MEKEIHEQPESLVNTMRGRVNLATGEVKLGGVQAHLAEIKRCRRLILIACGTSYHSGVAVRTIAIAILSASAFTLLLSSSSVFIQTLHFCHFLSAM